MNNGIYTHNYSWASSAVETTKETNFGTKVA